LVQYDALADQFQLIGGRKKPTRYLICGELNNTVLRKLRGWMKFAGKRGKKKKFMKRLNIDFPDDVIRKETSWVQQPFLVSLSLLNSWILPRQISNAINSI